jgi:RimJ/RimL family protein N-acetyltransferase
MRESQILEVIQTDRLVLRWLTTEDAAFIHELLNDPDWLRYIGDRGVRTLEDARNYLLQGPIAMYAQAGFGLYRVELRESRVPIGICGLLKRDALEDVDIGFAFLPQFRGQGYASEAAAATLAYGKRTLGLSRIVAIVSPENHLSIRLLGKLGLRFEQSLRLAGGADEVYLFGPGPEEPSGSLP